MPAKPTLADGNQTHVLILGAGMAGLCAAYELEKKNCRCTILEAEPRHVGGRVRTLRFRDGLYGEAGAMRIPTRHDLTRKYVAEFNLKLRPFVNHNDEAYFFARNRRVRNKDVDQLKPLYQLTAKEKAMSSDDMWSAVITEKLKSLSGAERADLLAVTPQTPAIRTLDNLSLQQLFDQSGLSQEAIEFMAVTQAQEAEMEYACTESLREEMKEIWTHDFDEIVGETDTLPAAFAKNLRTQIRHGCEVIALCQNPLNQKTSAWFIEHGQKKSIEADYMICTLPVPVMQRLLVDPAFSPQKAHAIRNLTYDSATKVLFQTSRRFWETDDGIFGGGTHTDLPTGSSYYPSDNAQARDPKISARPAVMLASYSWGMPARRLAAMPHHQRVEQVTRHLGRVHRQLLDPGTVVGSASWSWDTHPWSGGAFAWFNPNQHSTLYASLIAPEGRIHFAGEHASLTHTWIQGALESALRAVTEILRTT
jgi:monoamine oxidase